MTLVPWKPNLEPGCGYDTISGDAKQEGVIGTLGVDTRAAGQTGDTSFTILESADEFDKALDIDAEVSVGAGPFSGNAKFGFKERNKVSSQSTFCMIRVFAVNAYERLRAPKFGEEAWRLLEADNQKRFRERFGDMFVSGRYAGVEFYGSIRIEAESMAMQREIAAELSASYGPAISGQASMKHSENMSSSKHKIEAFSFQKGGEISLTTTLDELVAQARAALVQCRSGMATPFSVEVDPYNELAFPGDDATLIDVESARSNIEALTKAMEALRRMSNEIDFVLRHQDWFVGPDVAALNNSNAAIIAELNKVKQRAVSCTKNYTTCEAYAPIYPAYSIPPRKAESPTVRVENEMTAEERRLQRMKVMATIKADGFGAIQR